MKKISLLLLASIIFITGCGGNNSGQSTSEEDIQGTAESIAATMIFQTQEAYVPPPTNTTEPTQAPTETLIPTDTLAPAPTEPSLPTATQLIPTETSYWATDTPTPFVPPTKVTLLKFINESGKEVLFIFTQPEYKEYRFTSDLLTEIKFGTHYFIVWIGDDGPYYGSISVTMADKYEIVIEKDKVRVRAP
jgi:hypothetical protein